MVSSTRRSPTPRAAEPRAQTDAPRELLPWLAEPLRHTLATQQAHALLLQAPPGVGQFDFAVELARAWLCETPQDQRRVPGREGLACGHCSSCHLVDERSHPDLRLLVPEALRAEAGLPVEEGGSDAEGEGRKRKPSREIKVDQVRAALDFAELTAGRARLKVLLLHPAEAMNAVAANALLKTLEEPGALRFVLSCGSTDSLLPTIRSRCQAVRLLPPAREQALVWLQSRGVGDAQEAQVLLDACGGRPLEALQRQREGMDAQAWRQFPQWVASGQSAAVSGWPLPVLVEALSKLCHDRSLVSLGLAPRYFTRSELAAGDLDQLTAWAAQLRRHARVAEHPFSAGLAVEALMLGGRF
ncbi:MAG: DNA polymerase III subunit delta' [Leptothrix sp. (in: Bacteria)]|jgi:DNA polymerase-3 subunit delta'|nr:DNA polymerase III subunit delta' [Leptothrix sp. (in: b-proteobacteria)]HQY09745.1 DNA polymerase III subunit delta' [Burkholderiaceae bacterium]